MFKGFVFKTFRIPQDPRIPVVENEIIEWKNGDYDKQGSTNTTSGS